MIMVVGKGEDMSGQPSSLGSRGGERGEKKKKIRSFQYLLNPQTATERYLILNGLGSSVTDQVSESIHLKSAPGR